MSLQAQLLPVFVHVALTFALVLWLARLRVSALNRKEIRESDIALGQKAWPEQIQKVGNSFENQLELPLLFYVVVILFDVAHVASLLSVILSWVFVATRFVHAYIHTGSNKVTIRGPAYGLGLFVLIAMWVILAIRILAA
jgi:hypothetical protein